MRKIADELNEISSIKKSSEQKALIVAESSIDDIFFNLVVKAKLEAEKGKTSIKVNAINNSLDDFKKMDQLFQKLKEEDFKNITINAKTISFSWGK